MLSCLISVDSLSILTTDLSSKRKISCPPLFYIHTNVNTTATIVQVSCKLVTSPKPYAYICLSANLSIYLYLLPPYSIYHMLRSAASGPQFVFRRVFSSYYLRNQTFMWYQEHTMMFTSALLLWCIRQCFFYKMVLTLFAVDISAPIVMSCCFIGCDAGVRIKFRASGWNPFLWAGQ